MSQQTMVNNRKRIRGYKQFRAMPRKFIIGKCHKCGAEVPALRKLKKHVCDNCSINTNNLKKKEAIKQQENDPKRY